MKKKNFLKRKEGGYHKCLCLFVCMYVCMCGGCDDLFNISMDIHYIALNTSAYTMWVYRMCHVIIMVIIIK